MQIRSTTTIVCGLGFILAGVVAFVVARVSLNTYAELNRVRLDPLGIQRFPGPHVRPDGSVIIIHGDSRAAHWPAPPEIPGASIVNRGISGQTSAQVLARYEAHVGPLVPEVVVLQVGGNDLKTVTLFREDEELIISRCIQNIRAIVNHATHTGAIAVVTTIFPHGRVPLHRRPVFDSRVTEATKRVNAEIRRMAAPNVIVMDCDEILAGPDGLIHPDYSRDLLHLTPKGYEALNQRLASILNEILGRPKTPKAANTTDG